MGGEEGRGLAPFGSNARFYRNYVEKGACPRMPVYSRKKCLLPGELS